MTPVARRTSAISQWTAATERRRSVWRRLTPPQLFVGSFMLLVLGGTLGLQVLPGLYTGERLDLLDSLFTATSAVCVTGLVVVDTATFFTPFGQAYLLLLIQLGGLGMITFTTLIILALGRRLSLRQENVAHVGAEVAPHIRTEHLTRDVVRFTLALEAFGALALWALWAPRMGAVEAIWPAVFHAISAFCNAGFSTFSDSLVGFQGAPATLVTVMLLVIAGGLGFLTMEELALWRRAHRSRRQFRLSVHSRLALLATAVLIVVGAVGFALFEWHNTLAPLALRERVFNALFMSVTPRTAGFNSVDYTTTTTGTNFLTILLMVIGGSPGSTAGGVKTTTVALLVLLAVARFQGRRRADFAARTIPTDTIQRAVGLALTAFAFVTAAIFVLTLTEGGGPGSHANFLPTMFEAASAFNTVGLSMNMTPTLSDGGRRLVTFLMFVGRVGPLTFAAALAMRAQAEQVSFRYAREDVVVG